MKLSTAVLAAFAGLAVAVAPVHAQPAGAIGKPLSSPDYAVGTVTVKIIAGAVTRPVPGIDVTLIVNGEPRVARTDTAGRASFVGLSPGATVQAKALDDDKKDTLSDEFIVPATGGMRVMLTTKPIQANGGNGGNGGAPFAGGMPSPRQMSGEPRYDQQFEPGSITVAVTYANLALDGQRLKDNNPPVGVTVMLVGYHSDDTITTTTQATDASGEARFAGLDRTGNTTYFAAAQLPRNGAFDRLVSMAMPIDAQAGVKLVLSGEKRDSTAPPVDDMAKLMRQEPETPANKVRVTLNGIDEKVTVSLVDATTHQMVAQKVSEQAPPDPTRLQAQGKFDAQADLPAGNLDVEVRGGPGKASDPLADIEIKVIDADAKADATPVVTMKTDSTGKVRMLLPTGKPLKAIFNINGKEITSQPFDLSKKGGRIPVTVHWESTGRPQAIFDVAPQPNQVLYAELVLVDNANHQHLFRTPPVLVVDGHGTSLEIAILERVGFRFHMGAVVEDAFLGVQGEFEVYNSSWAPFAAGPDGMVIPLPSGFKGVFVDKNDQQEVAIDADKGFRIVKPLSPGQHKFRGGFSMPVEGGTVKWALDLPYGAFQSNLNILQFPGMSVQLPPNAGIAGELGQTESGQSLYAIPGITIEAGHSMGLTIRGLPNAPAWKKWVPRAVGLLVLLMMGSGIVMAVVIGRRRAGVDPSRGAKRAKLLDELVELDRSGKDKKRRDVVLAELESLWDD